MRLPITLLLLLAAPAAWAQSLSPELEEVKGTVTGPGAAAGGVGYTIRVPKGASVHRTGTVQDLYSKWHDPFASWKVQVETTPVRTLEAALKESTVSGRLFTPEGSAVEGGFQVLRRPTSSSVMDAAVWAYKVGEQGGVRAQCSGPAKAIEALTEMCSSLKLGPPAPAP
jgi:hypothetical protein